MGLLVIFSSCCIWFPIAVWVVSIVHWAIMQEIDIITAIAALGVAFGLGIFSMNDAGRNYSPIMFVAVLATVVFYPFVQAGMAKRQSRSFDADALAKAYDALKIRPDNPSAKFVVARRAYDLGMPGHALRIAEAAVSQLPVAHFYEEHRITVKWQKLGLTAEHFLPIACIECGHSNIAGNVHCAACGGPFLLDRARGRAVNRSLGRKLLAAWASMVMLLVGIPASTPLPPLGQAGVIIGMLVISALLMVMAFKPSTRTT